MRGLEVLVVNVKQCHRLSLLWLFENLVLSYVANGKSQVTIRQIIQNARFALEIFMHNMAFAFEGIKAMERETTTTNLGKSNPTKRGTVAAVADSTPNQHILLSSRNRHVNL